MGRGGIEPLPPDGMPICSEKNSASFLFHDLFPSAIEHKISRGHEWRLRRGRPGQIPISQVIPVIPVSHMIPVIPVSQVIQGDSSDSSDSSESSESSESSASVGRLSRYL